MKTEHKILEVADGSKMRTFFAYPDGAKAPAVIVLQEAFGVNPHIREVSERLAKAGYLAVAPELYHRTAAAGYEAAYSDFPAIRSHLMAVTPETLKLDLDAIVTSLKQDSHADANRLAAVGFCLGGYASFVANGVLPLKGAVSFYGSRIPTLSVFAKTQSGPMMLIWGGADAHIDPAQREQVLTMMREHKKPFNNVEFSEADHGFFCPDRTAYHKASADQAWALMQAFLKTVFI